MYKLIWGKLKKKRQTTLSDKKNFFKILPPTKVVCCSESKCIDVETFDEYALPKTTENWCKGISDRGFFLLHWLTLTQSDVCRTYERQQKIR